MNKKKTHKEYVEEVSVKNPTVEVVGWYVDAKTKIKHRCKICGYEWDIKPSHILNGIGCPECKNKETGDRCRKTHKQYIEELNIINPDVCCLGEYINAQTKIMHQCKNCGHQWRAKPVDILSGRGCPECKKKKIGDKLRKSNEKYIEEVSIINPNIEVVGEYINGNTKIKHRCKVCGNEWDVKPNHILYNHGCPKCKKSFGEKIISEWLTDNNIDFVQQYSFCDCRDKFPLPFDFYLPNSNTCIEFDGEQHFKPVDFFGGEEKFKVRQLHDQIKTDYCNSHDIYLLRIPYDKNIEEELNNFLFI